MKKIISPLKSSFARIRIFGVGGSGKNATNHMIKNGVEGVEFIAANTDSQDLKSSKANKKIHLGKSITRGLGTGMNPSTGKNAAEEVKDEIVEAIKGSDLIFISGGMGGGTGTGASPVIARIAKELGVLTVAIVTTPFNFEGGSRKKIADEGIKELAKNTDSLIIIPNDNILKMTDIKTNMSDAFSYSDDVLLNAVKGISDLIIKDGDINVDFADIRAILKNSGVSLIGIGKSKGANRAENAVQQAISSPLIDVSINGATKILFSIASRNRKEVTMTEVQSIAQRITQHVDKDAMVIFGTYTDNTLKQGEIKVTVLASSFKDSKINDALLGKNDNLENTKFNSSESIKFQTTKKDNSNEDQEQVFIDDDYQSKPSNYTDDYDD